LKNLVQSGWRDRAAMSSRAIEDRLFFICALRALQGLLLRQDSSLFEAPKESCHVGFYP
jgi:hypothetical protein